MISKILKYFFLFFLVVISSGCQINETLSSIKDSIKINKEKLNYVIKEEKNLKKSTNSQVNRQINNDKLSNEIIDKPKEIKLGEKVLESNENEDLALIYPKIKKKEIEFYDRETKKDLVVGLLLPLTGNFSKLGNRLINSVRLFPENNSDDITFKVYDTNGTSQGAYKALRQGIKDEVKYYLGPIFSNETYALKKIAKKNEVSIFSLSNDKTNESENIFISGMSVENEILCILNKITDNEGKKIGVIHDGGMYGKLVEKNIKKYSLENDDISFLFLEKSNLKNLDEEIRKFSGYDEGVRLLQKEIENVKNLDIEEIDLAYRLKELEKLETLGDKPFDNLIIALSGSTLIEALALLAFYDINTSNVNIYGTNIWEGIHLSDEDVLDNTFYASSLSNEKEKYKEKYFELFKAYPNNLNYVLADLINFLIYNSKNLDDLQNITNTVYNGDFGSLRVTDRGSFERKIFINKFNNGLLRQNYTCSIQNI